MLRAICKVVSVSSRCNRERPLAKPKPKPIAPPTISPAMARRKLIQTFCARAPDKVSFHPATATAAGEGRMLLARNPKDELACQTMRSAAGKAQPARLIRRSRSASEPALRAGAGARVAASAEDVLLIRP